MNLKDLATHLRLSPTTVSRALGGYPDVAPRTRARVEAAAREFGYRPNLRARALATGRSMAIGHVIPAGDRHEMVNPVFADFVAGAGESYGAAGYAMKLLTVPDGEERAAYRALAAEGSVDGVMLHAPRLGDARPDLLDELALPYLVHGRAGDRAAPYAWLDVDNAAAIRAATEHLLQLGHRRIALVNGPEALDFACRRRRGYETALAAQGVAARAEWMVAEEMTEGLGFRAATRMLDAAEGPTAFVVASIISAIGVRRAISQAGLRMGADVSVAAFDDDLSYIGNDGPDARPLFTAMRASVREGGRLAARMLIERIAAPNAPPPTRLIRAELIVGRSTGPAPSV